MTAGTVNDTDRGLDTPYALTDAQVRMMHEDSWALLPGLLGPDDLAKIRESLAGAEPSKFYGGPDKVPIDPKSLTKYEGVAWKDPYLRSLATSTRLSSAVIGLMKRPEAVFVQDISFLKPPGGSEVPFHQDLPSWPFDRPGVVSLWIALDDMDEDMGPLRYLKGSHLEGTLGLRRIMETNPQLRDFETVAGKPLKAGDAQAHWGQTVHGSAPNAGTRNRDALAFRYHRSDAQYNGIPHIFFDDFDLKVGSEFAESDQFPRIGPNGLIDG